MSADRYTTSLKCSNCDRQGKAHYRENDGWSFMRARDRSVTVTEGFTVVDHGRNHGETTVIQCACGNSVVGEIL